MLTPKELERFAQPLIDVYAHVNDVLIVNIARHFNVKATGNTGAFDWQVKMLAEAGQVTRENRDIIAEMTGANSALLREALTQAMLAALDDVEPELREAAKKGLLAAPDSEAHLSPSALNILQRYYDQAADKLNLVNTVMLQSSLEQYRKVISDTMTYEVQLSAAQQILNQATGEALMGASSQQTAMRRAVERMTNEGLTGFVDRGGHHWSPEAYVAMDIRTTVTNTAHESTWARCDEYGADLIMVSSKAASRPLCYPWQGKVLSRSNRAGTVEDLDGKKIEVIPMNATSYGQPAGLFGINCGHFSSPFIPGMSKVRGEPPAKKENEKQYAESQRQDALERKIRKANLMVATAKAMNDDAALKQAKQKQADAKAEMQAFIDETGRTRRKSREYTPTKFDERWAMK